ncbi:MAG: hypothetical protein ACOYH4_03380 [Saccharofermentanales bacterium]|jgi:dihydroorotase-like cyclic amidohydrolase
MGKLIKNGTILTAESEYKADVLIEGEKSSPFPRTLTRRDTT